jgi:succinate-semialdehyde dehydrogenase/glutarate-semialdehyde dehydrogenase
MRRAAELLRARAAELARLAALEMVKPLADGIAEAQKCASACEHYAAQAAAYLAPRVIATDASSSEVRFEPLGVVLAIMPWNFPYWQVFRFVAPHLMAGNAGLLKHAPNVSGCALAIEALLADAGFPRDLLRVRLVDTDEVARLIGDERVAAVTLTGSERAGRAVAELAGRALKPAVLELGGSDAFVVLADADVEKAARVAAQARTINNGQSCICAKRFIVERAVRGRFEEILAAELRRLRVGDPLASGTQLGPLARRDLRDNLHRQVLATVAQGARLVLGGEVPPGPGCFYPPTLLTDVRPGMVAAEEETFGPLAAVLVAESAEEAVAMASASRFGLGASLWTKDAARWIPALAAGSVFVNGFVKSDPRLPFGGIKASGFGRELGEEGIRAFTNVKTVWVA